MAAVFVILLLGIILYVASRPEPSTRPAIVNDPRVHFMGVRPDGSDDLYDASGQKIGQLFNDQNVSDWPSTFAR